MENVKLLRFQISSLSLERTRCNLTIKIEVKPIFICRNCSIFIENLGRKKGVGMKKRTHDEVKSFFVEVSKPK